ncbi:MAG: hypothetical protein SFW67_10260 [Myxococcaceae bacterium]|nr:hypothetical protein [Myxococcaceae bacterium]
MMQNLVLTGLRGLGKTVLLDTFKPLATEAGWLWVGTDLSEAASVSEETLANRLMTDLAAVTAGVSVREFEIPGLGFGAPSRRLVQRLTYDVLKHVFDAQPGLVSDKVKAVLQLVHTVIRGRVLFAYDEAQNLADHALKEQYPLSLLLDVFQSVQRQGMPFMLVLTGLPTLFPKLVEARTFAERMFRVVFLDRLNESESRDAIERPLQGGAVQFSPSSIEAIVELSAGYPYFLQFICREVFDAFVAQRARGQREQSPVALDEITRKLDSDFFAGRWAKLTDRQRELVACIGSLDGAGDEFTVQEIVEASRSKLEKGFSASHTNQMLASLANAGLVYKNRHGKYSFAVPLFGQFVRRQGLLD